MSVCKKVGKCFVHKKSKVHRLGQKAQKCLFTRNQKSIGSAKKRKTLVGQALRAISWASENRTVVVAFFRTTHFIYPAKRILGQSCTIVKTSKISRLTIRTAYFQAIVVRSV